MATSKGTDWESMEADYRAGMLSVRVIAKKHDISESMVRKKAGALGWERALADKVREAVEEGLVRTEVRTANTQGAQCAPAHQRPPKPANPARDREIIQAAAATGIAVVQAHRQSIHAARSICGLLLNQLHDASQDIEAIEDAILTETQDDAGNLRRNQMMKAVSLSTRAGTVRDLSTALKNLVTIERQAFGLDRGDDDKKKATPMMHIHATTNPATPVQMEEPNE
ncbi:hypothetical protein [Chitinimonas sp. BJB300]|uniref:hypothetical protein n=2 Tax=Chitinimonas sp. BJB300 TaxID=1559339 RepID=UPI001180022A|nr:hypothetical protein [Chitinimonas sp. BJB300]